MSSNNDGWVESIDPNTGRTFYANHVTRVTQWDPPPGWNSNSTPAANNNNGLPMGWEEMKDPQSGRSFYVDHANQITTWTKPTTDAATSSAPVASAPVAAAAGTTSAALQQAATTRSSSFQHHQQQQHHDEVSSYNSSSTPSQQPTRTRRTWSDASASSYFRPTHNNNSRSYSVDFSDAFSKLDFKVQKVEDALRPTCASCNHEWSLSKRRHHCRLCGDVYCDKCSPHKVELPLEGVEFQKPVRICTYCHPDVEQGNYFSQRRYLTPLTLYDPPEDTNSSSSLDDETGVATHETVAAALCALTSDLDALILNASSVSVQLTLEASLLVPAICKHLPLRETSDRAVRCLASLLTLGSMASNIDYAKVFYQKCTPYGWEELLSLLERSGSDRRTLYTQEQATKAICYLTESSLLKKLDRMNDDNALEQHPLDIPRALRAMLDHASSDQNPNLQRWAASGIRHLVLEEERRLTSSANEIANVMAVSPNDVANHRLYESFLPELVSTGGILILCSLMGADDSDTRAHATAALGATLDATRAMDESLANLYDLTGGFAGMPSSATHVQIIRAIVSAGGCSQALSQLFQSAENSVARMGCDFCASLVMPLLEDARGTATLEEGYDPSSRGGGNAADDDDDLGASREAALALASGPCLPSLLSLVRSDRPIALKQAAMESLAAIAMAVGEMTKANPPLTDDAVTFMLEEGTVPLMLHVLEEFDSSSLTTADTPSSRIREAAGIVISAMAICSLDAMMELQSSRTATTIMWSAMNDLTVLPSRLRGDGAPHCLGMLQTAAALLTYSQHDESVTPSERMDRLLEAVDAGAVPVLSKILFTKIDYGAQNKAVGAMKARDAACRMLTALFDIARASHHVDDGVCHNRLWDAVDADAFSRSPAPRSIVTAALQVLHNAAKQGRLLLQGARRNKGPHFTAAVMDLVESSLYAVGSMCGSTVVPGLETQPNSMISDMEEEDTTIRQRRREASAVACDILTRVVSDDENLGTEAVLPTMLVGGFGEKTLLASLRLALAIGQNGNLAQHAKLASSGILVPLSDSLQSAMTSGDSFRFSACLTLLKYVGPHVSTQGGQTGQMASVQAAIRTATSVLQVPGDDDNTRALKESCMSCLEALSSNASLWTAISKDALPSIVLYVTNHCNSGSSSSSSIGGALKALTRIVAVPSHGVAAARAGLPEALGRVLVKYATIVWPNTNNETTEEEPSSYYDTTTNNNDAADDDDDDDPAEKEEIPLLALDILYTLHQNNKEVRRSCYFLDNAAVLEGLVCVLSRSATRSPKPDGDGRADVCLQSLELLLALFRADSSSSSYYYLPLATQLTTPRLVGFLEVVSREPTLVQTLGSTLMASSKVLRQPNVLPHYDASQQSFEIASTGSPPLLCVAEKCGPYPHTHMAALQLLYRITVLAQSLDNNTNSDLIWSTLLTDNDELAMTICAQFLLTINDLRPTTKAKTKTAEQDEFDNITSPLVRHVLLETLLQQLDDDDTEESSSDYAKSVLVAMQIPSICLSLWTNPHLQNLAFTFVSNILAHDEELAVLFVEQKSTLQSLFDMLSSSSDQATTTSEDSNNNDIRGVVAHILQSLAESGVLTKAVTKFGLKSAAISALAKACTQENSSTTDDAVATSATLSARCMECLVDLLLKHNSNSNSTTISILESDAQVIAKCLGSKICHMVLTRFLERAKLSSAYDDHIADDDDICDAPYVLLLVSMAQHKSALDIMLELGGISALVMVAGEGHVPAVRALWKHADTFSSDILHADGHGQLYKLFNNNENESITPLETRVAAMELLAHLSSSHKDKKMMTNDDDVLETVTYALHCIGALDIIIKADDDDDESEETMEESAEEEEEEPDLKEEEPVNDDESEESEEEEEVPVPSAPVVVVTRRKKKQEAPPTSPADWMKPPPLPPPAKQQQQHTTMKKTTKVKTKEQTEAENTKVREKQETQLKYASLTFLSNLVPLCLDRLQDCCSNLVPIVHELSKNEAFELPALSFLQSLAPFATTRLTTTTTTTTTVTIDTDVLATVFLEALNTNKKKNSSSSSSLASKLVATRGLAILILDISNTTLQQQVVRAVVSLFQTNVKKCAVQRADNNKNKNNADRTLLAQLTYHLVMMMRQVMAVQRTILTETDLLVSMVHLIEWRYDSRSTGTNNNNTEKEQFLYWNGAVSQVLSHLTTVIQYVPETTQQTLSTNTVLVMARPGKAPRKTSNLLTSLERIITENTTTTSSSSDASAVLAARHLVTVLTK